MICASPAPICRWTSLALAFSARSTNRSRSSGAAESFAAASKGAGVEFFNKGRVRMLHIVSRTDIGQAAEGSVTGRCERHRGESDWSDQSDQSDSDISENEKV